MWLHAGAHCCAWVTSDLAHGVRAAQRTRCKLQHCGGAHVVEMVWAPPAWCTSLADTLGRLASMQDDLELPRVRSSCILAVICPGVD